MQISHPSHTTVAGVVLTVGEGDVGQLGLGPDVLERSRCALVSLPEDCIQVSRAAAGNTVWQLCKTSLFVSEISTLHVITFKVWKLEKLPEQKHFRDQAFSLSLH